MKKLFLLAALAGLGFVSCKKNHYGSYLKGTYKGTFKRYNEPGAEEANVSINFNSPNWSGTSDIDKYPALAQGRFSSDGEVIRFTNTAAWTADFDWTLILDGTYIERAEGDSLVFTKSYGNGWVDVYKLKKQ
ncbi:hypothetical protein [Parasegetibacter sp. NRK P23]|uniref:hypothetical protein n=1 Tax=Parasegetibacter sp. NRK P23 TaxID=2942999 RepID=UPI0020439F4E|nr:hypothetical protein [Parasegetibacter sp. NRK P23]MCM5527947.1 hypothetical protein [Parasegetibacter sp. NRK P23]